MSNAKSKKKMAALLLLIVIGVLAILLLINQKTALKSSFVRDGKEKLVITGEVAAVSNSNSIVHCVKDMLIEAQGENLRAKSINGNVAWSRKFSGKVVRLVDATEGIVIVDSLNNINYYSLEGKSLWTYKSPYEIIDLFTEANGSILVEYKGMTGSHAEVFTKSGTKIGSISVENSHILSFSAGTSSFSISVLDTATDSLKTKIITYNFKGDILWAQNFDKKLISMLNYAKSGKLLALGENIVYIYKNDGSRQDEVKIAGKINSVAMGDYITAITVQDKGKYFVVCYDANMKELSKTEIEENVSEIFPMKSNLILYNKDELMIISTKGELTARYKSNTDISSAYMYTDNKVYIVSNRTLQQLEYQK